MKIRYFLSMFSIYLIILATNFLYFVNHRSLITFLITIGVHFILLVIINFIISYFIYKPVDTLLENGKNPEKATKRIEKLTSYSSLSIFIIGTSYVTMTVLVLFLFPPNVETYDIEKVSTPMLLGFIPSLMFVYAILPSFCTYFIINDFSLDLKTLTFTKFDLKYKTGTKKIWIMLVMVFVVLTFIPSLLVIKELLSLVTSGDAYEAFSNVNPVETILVDRFNVLIGMVVAVFFITRSLTKPIYSLLHKISAVRTGNYNVQAPVMSSDEIGILTNEFNEMVIGLKERELIKDTFGKYLTKEVAGIILNNKIDLSGEMRLATILVTDIVSYTSISEGLHPKEIVSMLNEYFTEIVKIITRNNGIVNKFIGDSIFAIFNVPLDDDAHALNAIKAAKEINTYTENNIFGNGTDLHTRIGINTGEVLAGNLGSKDRMEYTVIGDEVNIASRLEQLNKTYNTKILIGENTYNYVKESVECTKIDSIKLKGKENSITVYTIM
jgi:class 3 adenylate cyclase